MSRPYLTQGLNQALRNLRQEYKIWKRHRSSLRSIKRLDLQAQMNLHLGSGGNYKQGWVNVDLYPGADLFLDLRENLPLPEGTVARIYTEHFLEHLQYPEAARRFLGECFRVLLSGGGIRIGVPDTEWPLREYCGMEQAGYFQMARENWHPDWCKTRMEHINYHFRQDGEHLFAYDYETLSGILSDSGFTGISRSDFDASIDSEVRKTGTLYVTAVKPR